MAVMTFDTHAIVKELTASWFTDKQAETLTRAVQQAHDVDLSNLGTKAE